MTSLPAVWGKILPDYHICRLCFVVRSLPSRSSISTDSVSYDYDLAVMGGGSGGMAVAKKAASYGAKVATASLSSRFRAFGPV